MATPNAVEKTDVAGTFLATLEKAKVVLQRLRTLHKNTPATNSGKADTDVDTDMDIDTDTDTDSEKESVATTALSAADSVKEDIAMSALSAVACTTGGLVKRLAQCFGKGDETEKNVLTELANSTVTMQALLADLERLCTCSSVNTASVLM